MTDTRTLVGPEVIRSLQNGRADGWSNLVTGLGSVERDKRVSFHFGYRLKLGQTLLEQMYYGDDVVARVIDRPVSEMTRRGIRISVPDDVEVAQAIQMRMDELCVLDRMADAMAWDRLFGGAVIFLGADDGQIAEAPLREKNIQRFEWMNVLDRYEIEVASTYGDPSKPKYGEPEFYRIVSRIVGANSAPFGVRIHESRIVRLESQRVGRREREAQAGWSISVIDRVYHVLQDFVQAYGGAAHLLTDFSQAVLRIKGLANMIGSDNEGLALTRIAMLDMARSIARIVPLDTEESLERQSTPVTGLPELLDRMAERLSVATDMPITLLMGRSPAGLNATGASDIRLWYDFLEGQQRMTMRRPLERIIRLMLLSRDGPTKGKEPDGWGFEFNKLWQQTDQEVVDTRAKQAETDAKLIDKGVLDPIEVRRSRFGGDRWTYETTLDPTVTKAMELVAKEPKPEPADDPPAGE